MWKSDIIRYPKHRYNNTENLKFKLHQNILASEKEYLNIGQTINLKSYF